jgi:hypothetical protein
MNTLTGSANPVRCLFNLNIMAHLQFYQRQAIYAGIQAGKTDAQIAREIEVHRSTVGREIKRSGGRENYQAMQAHQEAKERQCDAMLFRNTYSVGMDLFTTLQKRNAYYRYLFNTHPPLLDLTFFRNPSVWFYFFRDNALRNRFTVGEGGSSSLGGLNDSVNNTFNKNSGDQTNAGKSVNKVNHSAYFNKFGFAFSLACTANAFALFLSHLADHQKVSVPSKNCKDVKDGSTEVLFFHHPKQNFIQNTSCFAHQFKNINKPYTFSKIFNSLLLPLPIFKQNTTHPHPNF